MFPYQGNNICNKLAITLIFMDYVYNLECIMCLGGEKNPTTKAHKIAKPENIITEYKTKPKASSKCFWC